MSKLIADDDGPDGVFDYFHDGEVLFSITRKALKEIIPDLPEDINEVEVDFAY
jgi:hypothetical protein